MSKRKKTGSYEVGYGKPPEDRQFKKGVSGNPSGRPKKASDLESELIQELSSKVIMNENGKRKIIKKSEGLMRQLVNKAISGNLQAARLVINLRVRAQERAAEQQQGLPNDPDVESLNIQSMTDEELEAILRANLKRATPDETA
jgi:hypothetical protein